MSRGPWLQREVTDPAALKVLFVCMGNICRSPTAEAMLRSLAPQLAPGVAFEADSAATHDYHLGAAPDLRSQHAARTRGIDMSDLRARKLVPEDFYRFDWIIVMDENNRRDALEVAHAVAHGRSSAQLARLLDFAPEQPLRDVPDPYYGKDADFAQVVALIETGVRGFIAAQLAASAR